MDGVTVRVAAIVGPTAVGKSSAAVEVAEALGAEIVSVDSMQVYSGMDIGTDKATSEMRWRVPHHLLDHWLPSHNVTVSEFQAEARNAISHISKRGVLPLLVGGSGLYFRAVVDDLFFPPRSANVREALELEVDELGSRALHARLTELDPRAAAKIEPQNARRIVRALEVIKLTGEPFSDNDSFDRYESIYDLAVAGLTRPRPQLHERIDARVTRMIERGLVEEARRLAELDISRTARQALGYRQVLDSPEADPATLGDEIARATKRFARRQESWFRADPRVEWFDADDSECTKAVIDYIRSALRLSSR
ncbi:MAG TPA: tRNA (adenosine(37)-N6)-dimethylallyltransferase MiaA [Actinomycetota bacterium]|nr:tRNA (adenosine(37)-N6)-dimethylallyltransferase MiaA [Actinomycetota bacterium]